MHINNKHKNQTQKSGKTMLSSQGPQWSRHYVARVRRCDDRPPSQENCIVVSDKCGETRNSCLLSIENLNGSRHLVF